MAACAVEDNNQDLYSLVNKGPHSGPRKPLHRYSPKQKKCNDVVFKTIYDPTGTISKGQLSYIVQKQHKRITSVSLTGLPFDVPYSLNKQRRWEKVNPKSLLLSNSDSAQDVLVVEGVGMPSVYDSIDGCRIQRVHLLEDDSLSTVSTSGKPKSLEYFNTALRERNGDDNKDSPTIRIQYNIIKPVLARCHSGIKSSRKTHRKTTSLASFCDDIDDFRAMQKLEPDDSFDLEKENEESYATRSLKITLADFLPIPSTSFTSSLALIPKKGENVSTPEEDAAESKKIHPLVDISDATHRPCIFEVFDIKQYRLKPYDLQEKIATLVPLHPSKDCVVRWLSLTRVSISSQLRGNTIFVVFFEIRDNSQTLRIRVNTNFKYSGYGGKNALFYLLMEAKDFDSLFNSLMKFVWKTRSSGDSSEDASVEKCYEKFQAKVNSSTMAAVGKRCAEDDEVTFIKEHHNSSNAFIDEVANMEQFQKQNKLCCLCKSSLETDLFPSDDGLICKNCTASIVLHQLRLKQFPVRIPLKVPSTNSTLDLLYAILPVPVISTLIHMSFLHLYPFQNPQAVLTSCPQCKTSLVVDSPSDYDSCSCSECHIHFCYRCYSEPHWPMNCEEFEQWRQKWEEQYPVERLCLDKDENVLRINCVCGSTFLVAESHAHGSYCPNRSCGHRYDKAGLMRNKRDLWFWYTARERQKRIEGRGGEMGKDGSPVVAECISQKRTIRKEFASIAAEARNLRFDHYKTRKFKKAVTEIASCRSEQAVLSDTRVTALLLVEHCSAWLYLNRSKTITRHLRPLTSKLFEEVKNVELRVGAERHMLGAAIEDLKKRLHHFILTFRKASSAEEETDSGSVILL